MSEWFRVSSNVVDREDLSIYEKMCCVVLARYSKKNDFSMDFLALKMGVEEIIAKGAFYSLMTKGILESVDQSQKIRPGTIIKADPVEVEGFMEEAEAVQEIEATEEAEEMEYDSSVFQNSDLLLSNKEKIHRVCEILEEKISEREAKIILSFADNDIKQIIEKYKVAKASQYSDKIEVLIHELQKKEAHDIKRSKEMDKVESEDIKTVNLESFVERKNTVQKTQLNTYKINQMKKYKGK